MCKLKTVDIKGKPYVEVNERLKYFRENYTDYSLETELISNDNGVCIMRAVIKNPEGVIKATGYAYEKENSTFINKTSYIENCETSAWGRALGNFGIGIDTSIASAEEVLNATNNQEANVIKKKPKEIQVVDNDVDIFEGLKACTDLENLKLYYKEQYKNVIDKEGFAKLKDEMKGKMYV